MPINIDDLQNKKVSAITYSPKFFDNAFTGRGNNSKIGLLSSINRPSYIPKDHTTKISYSYCRKRTVQNGLTTIKSFPLNPLTYDINTNLMYRLDDMTKMHKIAETKTHIFYIDMIPNAIIMIEEFKPNYNNPNVGTQGQKEKTNIFDYLIRMYSISKTKPNDKQHHNAINNPCAYVEYYSQNPMQEFINTDLIQYVNNFVLSTAEMNTLIQNTTDYIANYDVFIGVSRMSEIWQNSIDKEIALLLEPNQNIDMYNIKKQIHYLMNYNVPLELYRNIYTIIQQKVPQSDWKDICKQNLNLLLSDTLNHLDNCKSNIKTFQPITDPAKIPASCNRLSSAQKKAVESTEPLIMVQAGAGTGKSTLILGRIDYLIASGVKPEDITVLSFTNAAADHITEKNPNVHSMTIARMIHEIYTTNFHNHELSSLDTLINSIDIYYPKAMPSSIEFQFQRHLRSLMKNDNNSFTDMNNFIEDNYDAVINILNTMHQTSLELEIIICYQQIDNFTEPASVASKYLIIDEVQDNSIFEFVYMLKYVAKHTESLFIVGDCSQTLYEFRASNPRALNILESSGVFATYQLQINYRSTQEILDFANIVLDNIDANKYARIQLMSSNMHNPTEQEFLNAVQFNYHKLAKISDFADALPSIFMSEISPYLNQCLARGEKVAFLAYTRNDVNRIQHILESQYPNKTTVSLVPKKIYNSTIISTYIRKYWNSVKFMSMNNLTMNLYHDIMNKLVYLCNNDQKIRPQVQKMLSNWVHDEGAKINSWMNQVQTGMLTPTVALNLVMENMLQYEIQHNAIKQALMSVENQRNKEDNAVNNADFLVSTIHSAKGLEFDNVVVLYKNKNAMDEDEKRMYYVALTRAMKSEYILAYDTTTSPQIEADYLSVCAKLHQNAPAQNSPLNRLTKNRKIKI